MKRKGGKHVGENWEEGRGDRKKETRWEEITRWVEKMERIKETWWRQLGGGQGRWKEGKYVGDN